MSTNLSGNLFTAPNIDDRKRKRKKRKEKKVFLFYIKPKVIVARNYTLCLTFSRKFPNKRTIYCSLREEDFVCGEWRQSQQTFLHYRTNSNRLACINLCWIFIRTQRQDITKRKVGLEILGDPSLRVNTQQLEMCIYCTASREIRDEEKRKRPNINHCPVNMQSSGYKNIE